jgi:hypothetical protein
MQRRPRQMRQRCLQGIKAVIERQERVPANGDDYCLVLDRQHRRLGLFRTGWKIGNRKPLPPLGYGFWLIP